MSQLEARPAAAARRRAIATNADEHLLLVGELPSGDFGRGSVADPELDRDRFGFAGGVEHPDAPSRDTGLGSALASARPGAGTGTTTRTLATACRPLPLLRFDAWRSETERGVGHPEN